VIQLLKFFTFLSQEEIAALEARHRVAPERREAQKKLAFELTTLVHGESATVDAVRASEILFGGSLEGITEDQFDMVAAEVPNVTIPKTALPDAAGMYMAAGLCSSKSQFRRDMEAGGLYVNDTRLTDSTLNPPFLFGKYLLLRKGKRNYAVMRVE
jgi:tyrosyl-tRNA synthetase